MRVRLETLIGNNGACSASKTIDLDFTPVPGMNYADTTWKADGGRKIVSVTIENTPDETPFLSVVLAPDDSEARDILIPMYEAHGWKVT